MLLVSPLRSSNHEREEEILDSTSTTFTLETDQEISCGDLFDCIDFDDIFMDDGDLLPDLEMEADIPAKFPASTTGGGEECNMDYIWVSSEELEEILLREEEEHKGGVKEEITSKTSKEAFMQESSWKETHEGGKLMFQSKESKDLLGKKKLKVDWTPELHRRFVQAVEQLGVDKAVPSRILELMGIDCLTRHNVASHLQKYRKHLQAREAKAASWSKYCGKGGINDHHRQGGNYNKQRDNQSKICNGVGVAPTTHMGMPQNFRPLHVWGHPSSNHHQSIYLWPKHHHLLHPRPYPPWAPVPPPASYWQPRPGQPHQVPHALTPAGTLCFPQALRTMRFPSTIPSVSSIPPRAMCKGQGINGVPNGQCSDFYHPLIFDSHPSKECIDAAIGDVLSKPWLPLPLGLKPPSIESVLGELQHQGVSKIPATCA